jgi:hypothetical protein
MQLVPPVRPGQVCCIFVSASDRCWGILEQHWNGTQLKTIQDAVNWARSMAWKSVAPNPGTDTPGAYFEKQVADVIVVYKGSQWREESSLRILKTLAVRELQAISRVHHLVLS